MERLTSADRLVIAGQPLTQSVRHTVTDILQVLKKDNIKSLYLLKDCCSALPGYELVSEKFLNDMTELGVNVINSTDASLFHFQTAEEIAAAEAKALNAKLKEEAKLAAIAAKKAEQAAAIAKAEADRLQDLELKRQALEAKHSSELAAAQLLIEEELARLQKDKDDEANRAKLMEDEPQPIQSTTDVEAQTKQEHEEEGAAGKKAAQDKMQEEIFQQECLAMRESFSALADDTRADSVLATLMARVNAASPAVRAYVVTDMTDPAAITALVKCLKITAAQCISAYSRECDQRLQSVLEMTSLLLRCDGHPLDDTPSSTVHMRGLKARQNEFIKEDCSDTLIDVLTLGDNASDALFDSASRTIGLLCCATDQRTKSTSPSKSKKNKKLKTLINMPAQDSFAPYVKNLLTQLKVHSTRRNNTALVSLCEIVLHITQDKPQSQRRLLDMQGVSTLYEILKEMPMSYVSLPDLPATEGKLSLREILLQQKSQAIQALKTIVDPSHRRSKAINSKVQSLAESIRNNPDEDEEIKALAAEILAKFNAKDGDGDSPRDDTDTSKGSPDAKKEKKSKSKKKKSGSENAPTSETDLTSADEGNKKEAENIDITDEK